MSGFQIARRFAVLWALVVACLCAPAGYAQTPVPGNSLSTCIARDTGQAATAMLADPAAFDCSTSQTDFGPGDFWAISQPFSRQSTEALPLTVRVASLWQGGLDLHIAYADGHVETIVADARGVTQRIQLGALVEYAIPPRDAPAVRLLWHVRESANMRGILLGARLSDAQASNRANLLSAAIYAGFAGLCLALLIYNFALWGALRHRFQLAYCAMVAALLLYSVSASGAMAWLMPDISNNLRLRVNYFTISLAAAAALQFMRFYFEPHIFAGRMDRLMKLGSIALALGGGAFFLFAPLHVRSMDMLVTALFVGCGLLIPAALWRTFRRRSTYRWLFTFAWAAPVVGVVARSMGNMGLIPWSFWLDNSSIAAMAAEAAISSLAIAYRIRVLSRERDSAIEGEVMARRLADTDPLTGLFNRRAFLVAAIGREGTQQLLLADIDHFKRVNDTLGHDGGDEVLRVFARTLRLCVPPDALVARIGGEEFAIVSDAGDPVEPGDLLAKLRRAPFPFDLRVTASIGTCSGPLTSEADWKRLYRCADEALFEAKASGRDRWRGSDTRFAA
ncbi:GGDEF domain-containing protein [Stakelama tenebrarum]|uniref:diguanylate cyclase n=1 Tax=Stakelama tenebrarum TaxID=2711215 RepID=A0A6G6Y8E7_9SPHN|nr:diguanylate cyclase [Sphingosinithalassobacter tenebrarum]QIG81121.1 diguanylate cyclase [Sphingosinithalassobacter tenebrarum]